jgi:hypothetical protein
MAPHQGFDAGPLPRHVQFAVEDLATAIRIPRRSASGRSKLLTSILAQHQPLIGARATNSLLKKARRLSRLKGAGFVFRSLSKITRRPSAFR